MAGVDDDHGLIGATPSGYRYIEKSCPRSTNNGLNTLTTHGGICFFYKTYYSVRRIQVPSYKKIESLAIQVLEASVNIVYAIIYSTRIGQFKLFVFRGIRERR